MARGPIPDKPRNRPTVPEVVKLIAAYYALPGNGVTGGNLHVVVDDGNLEDGHIEWCRNYCLDRDDFAGVDLADKLLAMTRTQRSRAYRRAHARGVHVL